MSRPSILPLSMRFPCSPILVPICHLNHASSLTPSEHLGTVSLALRFFLLGLLFALEPGKNGNGAIFLY